MGAANEVTGEKKAESAVAETCNNDIHVDSSSKSVADVSSHALWSDVDPDDGRLHSALPVLQY
jgi:hypothetical protein